MDTYIGFKIVQAEPCSVEEFNKIRSLYYSGESKEGYKVTYSDGYVSWSPKDIFEKAYLQIGQNNSITQDNVDAFIKTVEVKTIGEKTTFIHATLINGFEITESSSCVDPANYDEQVGAEICLGRIKNKIWELLGFLLQTANKGVK